MPPGTPYNSFVKPYPIRVDEFTTPRDGSLTVAALHLLTHTHSDHIIGLDAKSFSSTVICSMDAKEMLMRHETYKARYLKQEDFYLERQRTFKHLRYTVQAYDNEPLNIDLLRALPLDMPTKYEISHGEWVSITLIDANHCPGAVMYLIQGSKGSILHTGDFRAEPIFIETIRKNPFLRTYLVDQKHHKTLDAIYLDTSCMLRTFTVPTKLEATDGLVELMGLYPSHKRFFINTWTWGYEDILKAVSKAFGCKIHVDRYKYEVYTKISDHVLRNSVTQDDTSTRFHACERFSRCESVDKTKTDVVYVNPVNISKLNWEVYISRIKGEIKEKVYPTCLLVPLHRHSPLPELREFVNLFKPEYLVPNFLHPRLFGLDWACMPLMFGRYLTDGGAERMKSEILSYVDIDEVQTDEILEDIELSNFEGPNGVKEPGPDVIAWTNQPGSEGGNTKTGTMLAKMLPFLPGGLATLGRRMLMDARAEQMKNSLVKIENDKGDSSSDTESCGRMAELLFGDHLTQQTNSSKVSGEPEGTPESHEISLSQKSVESQSIGRVKNLESQISTLPSSSPTPGTVEPPPLRIPCKRPLEDVNNILEDWSAQQHATSDIGSIDTKHEAEFTQYTSRKRPNTHNELIVPPLTQQVNKDDSQIPPISLDTTGFASSSFARPKSLTLESKSSEKHKLSIEYDSSSTDVRQRRSDEERQLKRSEIARKLRLARPDLAALKSRHETKGHVRNKSRESNGSGSKASPTIKEGVGEAPLNWERIRILEKSIRDDLKVGRRPRLPALKCLHESSKEQIA